MNTSDILDDIKFIVAIFFVTFMLVGCPLLFIQLIDNQLTLFITITITLICLLVSIIFFIIDRIDRWYYFKYGEGKEISQKMAKDFMEALNTFNKKENKKE